MFGWWYVRGLEAACGKVSFATRGAAGAGEHRPEAGVDPLTTCLEIEIDPLEEATCGAAGAGEHRPEAGLDPLPLRL